MDWSHTGEEERKNEEEWRRAGRVGGLERRRRKGEHLVEIQQIFTD
jgi:hypothetical protein